MAPSRMLLWYKPQMIPAALIHETLPCWRWEWKEVLVLMRYFFAFLFFSSQVMPIHQKIKKFNRNMAVLTRHNFRLNVG